MYYTDLEHKRGKIEDRGKVGNKKVIIIKCKAKDYFNIEKLQYGKMTHPCDTPLSLTPNNTSINNTTIVQNTIIKRLLLDYYMHA
jgi:hypothetical protein